VNSIKWHLTVGKTAMLVKHQIVLKKDNIFDKDKKHVWSR